MDNFYHFLKIIPDIAEETKLVDLKMTNISLHGVSKFRIKYATADIKNMKAKVQIEFESLTMMAKNYNLKAFMTKSQGLATFVV